MACGTVCLEPLSAPCMEGRDKTKKLPWRLQSEKRQSSPEESECPSLRRGHCQTLECHPRKLGLAMSPDIPFTGVPVHFSESFKLIDCLAHPVHFCFSSICLQVAVRSCLVIVRYGSQRQSNLFKGIIPLGLAPHLVPFSW